VANPDNRARGRGRGYAPSAGAGGKAPAGGLGGKASQKLEYYCILCNGKSVIANTKM